MRGCDAGVFEGLARAMRLSEVPRPVLAAIAVLCAVALGCGVVLRAQSAQGIVVRTAPGGPGDDPAYVASGLSELGVTVTPGETASDGRGEDGGGGPAMRVHVDGSVAAPGVYSLADDARVEDAVAAAGGLTDAADGGALNLAAPVLDGAKIYVPARGESPSDRADGEIVTYSNIGQSTSSDGGSDGLIDINTATSEQLQALPGIGEATAAAIVEDRKANGPFSSPEDLMRVPGIGQKKFDRLSTRIRAS